MAEPLRTTDAGIIQRTNTYAAPLSMLKRAMPYLQLEKFGQTYPLPTNSTNTAKFRRYYMLGASGAGDRRGNKYRSFPRNSGTIPVWLYSAIPASKRPRSDSLNRSACFSHV